MSSSFINKNIFQFHVIEDENGLKDLEKYMYVKTNDEPTTLSTTIKTNCLDDNEKVILCEQPKEERKEHVFHLLQKKVTNERVIPAISPAASSQSVVVTINEKHRNPPYVHPKKEDTLFWCLYIANYGYYHFLSIEKKSKNVEIEEKQKIVDFLRTNMSFLKKEHKLSKVAIQEIMCDLMVNKKTTLNMTLAICLYYKITVFVMNKENNTYLEFRGRRSDDNNDNNNNESSSFFLINYEKNQFFINVEEKEKEVVQKTIASMFLVESLKKPLKGISTYKINELEKMAIKMNVCWEGKESDIKKEKEEEEGNNSKKRLFSIKKEDLYEKIFQKCIWNYFC